MKHLEMWYMDGTSIFSLDIILKIIIDSDLIVKKNKKNSHLLLNRSSNKRQTTLSQLLQPHLVSQNMVFCSGAGRIREIHSYTIQNFSQHNTYKLLSTKNPKSKKIKNYSLHNT